MPEDIRTTTLAYWDLKERCPKFEEVDIDMNTGKIIARRELKEDDLQLTLKLDGIN